MYLWYDTKYKKFIIGSHHGSTEDGYTTSTGGKHVRNIFKVRPDTVKRKILAYNSTQDIKETKRLEQSYLNKRPNILENPKYYNMNQNAAGGIGSWAHINNNPNRVNPMSNPVVRKHHATRMKELSSSNPIYFGDRWGDKNPMKRGEVVANHPALFSTKNNPMHDPAIRALNKKKNTDRSGRKVDIDGVLYPSLREAARLLDTCRVALRYRVTSKNFTNYVFQEELNA